MTRKTSSVAISLPHELITQIEKERGDLSRSLIYKKILEKGLSVENGDATDVKEEDVGHK